MLSIFVGLLLAINVNYAPPVDYEISLAGNFGEPRPNHFHGGIDVKTGGVEGKHIYSIGDGYVSRITVGLLGFGNAVYVTHPGGQTSVYCHLRSFSPRILMLLRRWQYAHQSYLADVRLSPLDCPVSVGQFIAVSGNTGASQAPHLHLELHDTRTWNMLDPLSFLGSCVKDGLAPMGHGFMAYPVRGEGTFNTGSAKQTFGFSSHNLTRRFTAWGKVGFGIWANDYMEATYNRYGVRETILKVDGSEVFHSNLTDIPVSSNRMVNSWGDYEHYLHSGVWYMKSFLDPGNTLSVLRTDANRGIIDFNEERDYHLEYILKDFKGNTSRYTFTVIGQRVKIPVKKIYSQSLLMRWNKINTYSQPGMQIVIPYGMLADDVELHPTVRQQSSKLSPIYTFYNQSYPLFNWAEISISPRRKVENPRKLYIVSHYGVERYQGGTYHNGWVTGRLRELGAAYELAYDDTPPVITPIGQTAWNSNHIIKLGLNDTGSGLKHYKGFIDGKFVLFEDVPKSPWVACRLEETPVARTGKLHHIKFTATDNRNNTKVFESDVRY